MVASCIVSLAGNLTIHAHCLPSSRKCDRLQVRLEHMLQRLRVLQQATLTGRPTRLLPRLFLSGAVEASSLHLLRHLRITHVLNATEVGGWVGGSANGQVGKGGVCGLSGGFCGCARALTSAAFPVISPCDFATLHNSAGPLLPEEGQGFVAFRIPLRDVEEEDLTPLLPGKL